MRKRKMTASNLKKSLEDNKLVIGTERTLKLLKTGKVKEVFVSKNCPDSLLIRLERYCEINKCKLHKLEENSKELGAICKKTFSISVCCNIK